MLARRLNIGSEDGFAGRKPERGQYIRGLRAVIAVEMDAADPEPGIGHDPIDRIPGCLSGSRDKTTDDQHSREDDEADAAEQPCNGVAP